MRALQLAVIGLGLVACATGPGHPLAEIAVHEDAYCIDVRGDGVRAVSVHVDGVDDAPALMGDLETTPTGVRFCPRYRLEPGLAYRVTLEPSGATTRVMVPPPPPSPTPRVEAVYPSGPELPENLLKFYLHFSEPMRPTFAYDHIRLETADGHPVAAPFLELGEELWDPEGRRFTLFLDPARVKRELRPNIELGRALRADRNFVLIVAPGWPSAAGVPLAEEVRRPFRAVRSDYAMPSFEAWEIDAPPAGTREPLIVRFDEPMDHALAHRLIRVLRGDSEVDGEVTVGGGERHWSLAPTDPWAKGTYRLTAEGTMEDRAGNSLLRPFEVDIFDTVERVMTKTLTRTFTID